MNFKKIGQKNKANKGFTLIEILIVIGIIAILAAIVIIAINPAKQFAQARNTQRTANVNAILNAVGQRIADNKGLYEGNYDTNTKFCDKIPASATAISTANGSAALGDTSANLGCLVPTYIPTLPTEPKGATFAQYTIAVDTDGRVTVCAPEALNETAIPDAGSTPICVTR